MNPVVHQLGDHRAIKEGERRHRQRNRGPQAESFHTRIWFFVARAPRESRPIVAFEQRRLAIISGSPVHRSKHTTTRAGTTEVPQRLENKRLMFLFGTPLALL